MATLPTISPVPRLETAARRAMFELHARFFDNAAEETFMRDLAGKDWAILLRDPTGALVGFSTLKVFHLRADGERHVFLYSGDTIVDKRHWQDSRLAGAFGHFMLRLMETHAGTPLHWILTSKGVRTYRFLPVFFRSFHPVFSEPTPPHRRRLMDAFAASNFGAAYDAGTNVLRWKGARDRLKPELCEVPRPRMRDPHVAFFLSRNPDYRLGDELLCMADIARANLTAPAWLVIERTTVQWDE